MPQSCRFSFLPWRSATTCISSPPTSLPLRSKKQQQAHESQTQAGDRVVIEATTKNPLLLVFYFYFAADQACLPRAIADLPVPATAACFFNMQAKRAEAGEPQHKHPLPSPFQSSTNISPRFSLKIHTQGLTHTMTTSSPRLPATAPTSGVVDAYTHYAPLALTSYLQDECNDGKPLVFAKLFDRTYFRTGGRRGR